MNDPILPVRLPFILPLSAEKAVDRFVYAYIVAGEQIGIVDTGAAGYQQPLVDALEIMGKSPSDVAWVINTHEHPDHVGGNRFFQEHGHPQFACHAQAVRWIEDLELQNRERPLYDFFRLAGKPINVARRLEDGDEIDFGGVTLRVLHTPGHSPGSISLFCPQNGALITADTLQPVGGLPLYADAATSRASIERLSALEGVQALYAAHTDQPYTGGDITAAFEAALDYLDRIDAAAHAAASHLPTGATPAEITRETLARVGLTAAPVMPITIQSVMSHLKV